MACLYSEGGHTTAECECAPRQHQLDRIRFGPEPYLPPQGRQSCRRSPAASAHTTLGPMFAGDKHQQCDAAKDSEDRTVIEDRRVANLIPKQTGDDAGNELQHAQGGVVPANPTGPQMLGYEVGRKRLVRASLRLQFRRESSPPIIPP
jgi:hypothetical protein